MEDSIKVQIAKELTLKAMEADVFTPIREDRMKGETIGDQIAKLFNSILNNIQC